MKTKKLAGTVLVEVYDSKKGKSEWLSGLVTGYVSGDINENFDRVNVHLNDGRDFIGCHPSCVKQDLPF